MKLTRNPKLIAATLIGGTLLLIGGGAVAASLPGPDHLMQMMAMARSHQPSASPKTAPTTSTLPLNSTSSAAATVPAAPMAQTTTPAATTPAAPAAAAPAPPITYVVKPGDTLSGIAAWFKLHGYGDLYSANAAVIGANPNLIRPGERITISGGVLTMEPPA